MGRKVVLYSGGLDSFCLAHAVKPDVLVFFNIGLPENDVEMWNIQRMEGMGILPAPVVYDFRFDLAAYKLPNEVLPFRNLFFIAAGFTYGSKVYLGKTASSRNLDKDPIFAAKALDVLKYVCQKPEKNPPGLLMEEMEILLPFDKKTKSMFLREYLENGGSLQNVLLTRSCYRPDGQECGECQSCIRKSIALINNGVDIAGMFEHSPIPFYQRQYEDVVNVGNQLVIDEVAQALREL